MSSPVLVRDFCIFVTAVSFSLASDNVTVGFQDLTPELKKEVVILQKTLTLELQPLILESTLTMQKTLECDNHTARLQLLRSFVEAETKRLQAKKAFQGMFTDEKNEPTDSIPPEEQVSDDDDDEKLRRSSSFFSDEDAFQ